MKKILFSLGIISLICVLVFTYAKIEHNHEVKDMRGLTILTHQESKPNFNKLILSTVQIKFGKPGGAGIMFHQDDNYLYMLTAKHLTKSRGEIQVFIRNKQGKFLRVRKIPKENVFRHRELDLALVKIPRPKGEFCNISLANKDIELGDTVYTIGHPVKHYYALNRGTASCYKKRTIANIKRRYLTITAPSFSGNSGGAVVNSNMELVGIAVGIYYIGDKPNPPKSKTIYLFHMTYSVMLEDIRDFLEETGVLMTLYMEEK